MGMGRFQKHPYWYKGGKRMSKVKVYVAGSYNADNIVKALDNMRIGMRVCTELLLEGYVPFVPWFDFHFQFMLREGETLTIQHYYDYCIEWLKVSDVMLVLPNSENSKGTQKEIQIARECSIPIFYSKEELKGENP